MKTIKIEKSVAGEIIQSFEVPLLLVRLSAKFLPQLAFKELKEKGFDLNEMLEVAKSNGRYIAKAEVVEKGIQTKVTISLV